MSEEYINKRDRVIEAIVDALPATSYKEIATKVSRAMRQRIGTGAVNNALTHLRRNSAEYGWTVSHVKRGRATDSDKGRFFLQLVDREGRYEMDSNPAAMTHLNNGSIADVRHAGTMLGNQAAAIRIAATATRSINERARLNDLADDFTYVAKKAAAVARELAKAA